MTPLITKGQRHFRFCTTPVFLDGQMGLLELWSALLSEALQAKVSFVQRRSYQAIVTLLKSKEADAAWLCGYPYVLNRDFLDLIAVTVYNGASLYKSYLVVNSSDKSTKTIKDLGQTVFAYSDPLSNSGFLVPRHILLTAVISPDQFFRKTFFTYSHQKVIQAVQERVADAGAVDSYVWETLAQQHAAAVSGMRVTWRSERYGFPPIVVRKGLPIDTTSRLKRSLLAMSESEEGQAILTQLNLQGFTAPLPALYDSIHRMARTSHVA